MPSAIAVGMALVVGAPALPDSQPVLGPELSLAASIDRLSLIAAGGVVATTNSTERAVTLSAIARVRLFGGEIQRSSVSTTISGIAQRDWWTADGDRNTLGFGIGALISSPHARHPGAFQNLHLDLRVMFAPRDSEAPILARTTEPPPASTGRDVGVFFVVGGELGVVTR